MPTNVRTIYEIHHCYQDGSSSKVEVALNHDGTVIYVQREGRESLGIYGPSMALSIADAIKALAGQMVVDTEED